jgi:hypothetical protein
VKVSRHKILFSSTTTKTFIQKFSPITIRHHSLCDTKFEFIILKSPRTKNQLIVKLEHAPPFHKPVVLKIYYCVLNFDNVLNTDPAQHTFSFFPSFILDFFLSVVVLPLLPTHCMSTGLLFSSVYTPRHTHHNR